MAKKIRVRMAPSPTGFIHLGTLRTALYNYYFAKQNNGDIILRVEDTDRKRFIKGAVKDMLKSFQSLGIEFDEGAYLDELDEVKERGEFGPYTQSKRLSIHLKYAEELIEKDMAYRCFCTKEDLDKMRTEQTERGEITKYDGRCREMSKEDAKKRSDSGESCVIRLKVPSDREIVVKDLVFGEIKFPAGSIDDQILMKSDGFPTYHLAVVVDDHLMRITHVFRGEEWLPSTPKQILLYEAFGWEIPQFGHLPPVVNAKKKKLSKRHGDVFTTDFLEKGYLPEALCNFISLIGWNTQDGTEKMTREEMVKRFDISRVQKSGGFFDIEKLNWMNGLYIREKTANEFFELAKPHFVKSGILNTEKFTDPEFVKWFKEIIGLEQERVKYLAELPELVEYYFEEPAAEKELLFSKGGEKLVSKILSATLRSLKELESWDHLSIENSLNKTAENLEVKRGKIFYPLRIALTGRKTAPGIFDLLLVLGKEKSIKRIEKAIS